MISTANLSRFINRLNLLFSQAGPIGDATLVTTVPCSGLDYSARAQQYVYLAESSGQAGAVKGEVVVLETGLYRIGVRLAYYSNAGTMEYLARLQISDPLGVSIFGDWTATKTAGVGTNHDFEIDVFLQKNDEVQLRQVATLGSGDSAAYTVWAYPIVAG